MEPSLPLVQANPRPLPELLLGLGLAAEQDGFIPTARRPLAELTRAALPRLGSHSKSRQAPGCPGAPPHPGCPRAAPGLLQLPRPHHQPSVNTLQSLTRHQESVTFLSAL